MVSVVEYGSLHGCWVDESLRVCNVDSPIGQRIVALINAGLVIMSEYRSMGDTRAAYSVERMIDGLARRMWFGE